MNIMRSFVLIGLLLASCRSDRGDSSLYDDSAVTGLLVLLDSIAARNPGYDRVVQRLEMMPQDERAREMTKLRDRNAGDTVLQKLEDRLLALDPYVIYFGRFTNVTPDDFRLAFNTLPFGAADLPGGVGDAFHDLFVHRSEFADWYKGISGEIDIPGCVANAARWLPPGGGNVRKVYAIYDGNAGSFAEQGSAFFNLCSEVITKSPKARRFVSLGEIGPKELQGVIAHELNHVMAEPFLFPEGRISPTWQERWKDRITRGIVSEGVAFCCNPPAGFQKTLWEDRVTVGVLIGELNRMMIAIDAGSVDEDSTRKWYGGLFDDFAQSLLERYLRRTEPTSDIVALLNEKTIFRPDLVHALGWWMVSRITGGGTVPAAAADLLLHPSSLYALYNDTLEPGMEEIAVDPRVEAMFGDGGEPEG